VGLAMAPSSYQALLATVAVIRRHRSWKGSSVPHASPDASLAEATQKSDTGVL
jgi:hypothetical protein